MNAMTTRQKNKLDKQIEEIVGRRCSGIMISVMDISKVYRAAYEAHATGVAPAVFEGVVVNAYKALAVK